MTNGEIDVTLAMTAIEDAPDEWVETVGFGDAWVMMTVREGIGVVARCDAAGEREIAYHGRAVEDTYVYQRAEELVQNEAERVRADGRFDEVEHNPSPNDIFEIDDRDVTMGYR
jgi:hypothetical protein